MKLENTKPKSGPSLTTLSRVVILIALYFLGGLLGKQASFFSGSVALVWPPAGIALAAILLFGYRFWPGVALGAVLFSFMNGMPLGFFTLGTAIGNTMGAIVCAFLLRKFIQLRQCPGAHAGRGRLHRAGLLSGHHRQRGVQRRQPRLWRNGVLAGFVPHDPGVVGAQCAGRPGGRAVPHHLGDALGPPLARRG